MSEETAGFGELPKTPTQPTRVGHKTMKLEQKKTFNEINIKLQTQEEAEAFFDLIDKLESFRTSTNWTVSPSQFTQKEIAMIIALSNARTDCEIVI